VQERYQQLSPIPCTKCGYCLPCPHGVNVPVNFELYNEATVYKGNSITLCRNLYHSLPEEQRAAACQACSTCEDVCPQGIDIGRYLKKVRETFE
jgi:predicted aldo/keto reductase-like oxidoreductase